MKIILNTHLCILLRTKTRMELTELVGTGLHTTVIRGRKQSPMVSTSLPCAPFRSDWIFNSPNLSFYFCSKVYIIEAYSDQPSPD